MTSMAWTERGLRSGPKTEKIQGKEEKIKEVKAKEGAKYKQKLQEEPTTV